MTRLQAKIAELAVALVVALSACAFALQVDVRSALESIWAARAPGPPHYTATALGGPAYYDIADVGNSGYLVGMAPDANMDMRANLWREGRMVFIDRSDCDFSCATAISSTNCVVFYVDTEQGVPGCRSYFWREPGPALPITRPGREDRYCKATAINSSGDVVGVIGGADEGCHAFVWREDSGAVVIDDEPSYPTAINDRGQVAGWRRDGPGHKRACVWTPRPDGYHAIQLAPDSAGWTEACEINNDGLAVGWGTKLGAFRWTAEDGVRVLPGLRKQVLSVVRDVNAGGDIAGCSVTTDGPRAVLWRGNEIIDLNEAVAPGSGWELRWAQAINDDGVIVCRAVSTEFAFYVVLTPMEADGGPASDAH